MAERRIWHRVKAPIPWRPKPGEELVGTYLSCREKQGEWGLYKLHYIKSRGSIFYVSGSVADNLLGLIAEGNKVKLIFVGMRGTDRPYKLYELYTEEAVEFKIAEVA